MGQILVTGACGFIGFHCTKALLKQGDSVIGVDNLNEYYQTSLKKDRLSILQKSPNFTFIEHDFAKPLEIKEKIDAIIHLGAQAGVRYSLENPLAYEQSNILGTLQIFEFARQNNIRKVIFASSSSVYGNCDTAPFTEDMPVDKPISLYAATKKSNELFAHTYHHLYGIDMVGLRFFTVYGPFGRPDMAYFSFTKKILANEPITVFNNGQMQRDFTYIDDIVSGILLSLKANLRFEIINLARGETVLLTDFIKAIENATGKKAQLQFEKMQPGDVLRTDGDISKARRLLGYEPKISINEGISRFVEWYREYYG